jgi:hypothetical protein
LPAQPALSEVRVISEQDGWLAVRAGSGPYLIGWTHVGLHKVEGEAAASPSLPTADPSASAPPAAATEATNQSPAEVNSRGVPARLINEPGQLRRVAAHSKVVFGEQVIGVFKTEGWARVIHTYDSGFADVFAAADDRLAIRGLMRTSDLLPVQAAMPQATTPVLTEGAPAQVWQPAAPTAPASEPVAQDVPPTAPPPVSPTPAPELAPAPAPSFVPAPVIAPVPLPETLAPTTR